MRSAWERLRQLSRTQLVGRPLPEVFAFFSDASNLDALTPPFLNFRILTPMHIEMFAGLVKEQTVEFGKVELAIG